MKIFVRTNYMYMLNVKVKKKTTKKRRKITDNKVTAKCHSLFCIHFWKASMIKRENVEIKKNLEMTTNILERKIKKM